MNVFYCGMIFRILACIIVSILGFTSVRADETMLTAAFAKRSGCFLLSDVNGKLLIAHNTARCAERRSPYSTFKIPLSLMAFDKNLITQETVFTWDKKDKGRETWNHDHTPHSWMTDSVVWVSQALTPKLGLETIKTYLDRFKYGNRDFSGGLAKAWLGSSLKISGEEQIAFLKNLVSRKLGVSDQATDSTIENIFISELPGGWKLYGKTGSGYTTPGNEDLREGWFVGFLKRNEQARVFVLNYHDLEKPAADESAGVTARGLVVQVLTDYINKEKGAGSGR